MANEETGRKRTLNENFLIFDEILRLTTKTDDQEDEEGRVVPSVLRFGVCKERGGGLVTILIDLKEVLRFL